MTLFKLTWRISMPGSEGAYSDIDHTGECYHSSRESATKGENELKEAFKVLELNKTGHMTTDIQTINVREVK